MYCLVPIYIYMYCLVPKELPPHGVARGMQEARPDAAQNDMCSKAPCL